MSSMVYIKAFYSEQRRVKTLSSRACVLMGFSVAVSLSPGAQRIDFPLRRNLREYISPSFYFSIRKLLSVREIIL